MPHIFEAFFIGFHLKINVPIIANRLISLFVTYGYNRKFKNLMLFYAIVERSHKTKRLDTNVLDMDANIIPRGACNLRFVRLLQLTEVLAL